MRLFLIKHSKQIYSYKPKTPCWIFMTSICYFKFYYLNIRCFYVQSAIAIRINRKQGENVYVEMSFNIYFYSEQLKWNTYQNLIEVVVW